MFKRHNYLVHSREVLVVVTIISSNSSSCIVYSIIFFLIKLVSHSTSCFHRFKIVKQPHGKSVAAKYCVFANGGI